MEDRQTEPGDDGGEKMEYDGANESDEESKAIAKSASMEYLSAGKISEAREKEVERVMRLRGAAEGGEPMCVPGAYAANSITSMSKKDIALARKRDIEEAYGSQKLPATRTTVTADVASYWEHEFTRRSDSSNDEEQPLAGNVISKDDTDEELATCITRSPISAAKFAAATTLFLEGQEEVMRSPPLAMKEEIGTSSRESLTANTPLPKLSSDPLVPPVRVATLAPPGDFDCDDDGEEYEIDLVDLETGRQNVSRLSCMVDQAELNSSHHSVPGAFREAGPGIATRRSSAVDELEAFQRQLEHEQREEDATVTSAHSHILTHSSGHSQQSRAMTQASGHTQASFVTAMTHSNMSDLHDSSNSFASDGPVVIPQAKRVSDAEPIYEAEQVQRDFNKRNQGLAALACLVALVAVIALVTVMNRNLKDEEREGDPRCWKPLHEQSVPIRCLCSGNNSTQGFYETELSDMEKQSYAMYDDMFRNTLGLIDESTPSFEDNMDSCHPVNQAILVASDFEAWNLSMEQVYTMAKAETATVEFYSILYFYIVMGGITWKEQDMWAMTPYICQWYGLDCLFVDVVSQMNLAQNGLVGTLPPELKNMKSPRYLDLSGNPGITGTIPPEIAQMTNLMSIDISGAHLIGTIPPELGELDKLSILQLRLNQLQGTIPSDLFDGGKNTTDVAVDRSLQSLNLAQNRLSGDIPTAIGLATRLVWLRLQGNQFSGLPTELELLTSLELLNLGDNNFSGPIPSMLGRLSNLEMINLHASGFTGYIPESFCETEGVRRHLVVSCDVTKDCSCCNRNNTGLVQVTCFKDVPVEAVGIDF